MVQTYLTIMVTALVLTQIIRLIQNATQLKHLRTSAEENYEVVRMWRDMLSGIEKLSDLIKKKI